MLVLLGGTLSDAILFSVPGFCRTHPRHGPGSRVHLARGTQGTASSRRTPPVVTGAGL